MVSLPPNYKNITIPKIEDNTNFFFSEIPCEGEDATSFTMALNIAAVGSKKNCLCLFGKFGISFQK